MNDQHLDIKIDYDDEGLYAPEGYSGLWEVYWPNRQLKNRATYVDGEEHGEVTCWWENGNIAQIGRCEFGVCRGVWADYLEDGTKFKETEYRDNDNFVIRWFSNGELDQTQEWKDGLQVR